MATRLAIREKQLETWTAIIQECADYQNNLDSCINSRIRINRGSIHIEIAGSAAPAAIRSIMEVLVDAE